MITFILFHNEWLLKPVATMEYISTNQYTQIHK